MLVIKSDFSEILQTYKGARLKMYRQAIHLGFIAFLIKVKKDAVKDILPGPRVYRGGLTRREAYKRKPSTPGRLTNRTGRLAQMLDDVAGDGRQWKGLGTKQVRSMDASRSFKGTVTNDEHYFYGRWTPWIQSTSPALRGLSGNEIETQPHAKKQRTLKQSLYFRAMWEHGLRGGAPRKFLSRSYLRNRPYYSMYSEPYMQQYFNSRKP